MYIERLQKKLNEALKAVLPIVGMMFFTLGAELAMQPMGEQLGSGLIKSRKLWRLLPIDGMQSQRIIRSDFIDRKVVS